MKRAQRRDDGSRETVRHGSNRASLIRNRSSSSPWHGGESVGADTHSPWQKSYSAMNAAPWVVDLPSVASSSTTLHLLHSPFSSTPLYAFLSSPPPLRAFPPRFSVLFLFSTRFPPFSFVGLGVGRPRPLPAFFRFGSIHRLLHRTPLSSVSLRSPRF